MSTNPRLSGGPPKDAEYTNVAVANTLVVRGKLFSQEVEAVTLTALDLSTLQDVVITGNQEVDGTSLFSGAASFQAPVSFGAGVTFAQGASFDAVVTQLSGLVPHLEGPAVLVTSNQNANLDFDLTNVGPDVPMGSTPNLVLFQVPEGSRPLSNFFFSAVSSEGKTALFRIDASSGDVTLVFATDAWLASETRNGHASFIVAR